MLGLLSEAIEPKANRRLLPPVSPSPIHKKGLKGKIRKKKTNSIKKAPCRAPAEGVSLPLDRDDKQRHTSPGAAGVFEGAAPPVLKCGQWDNYRTIFFRAHSFLLP